MVWQAGGFEKEAKETRGRKHGNKSFLSVMLDHSQKGGYQWSIGREGFALLWPVCGDKRT